MCLWQKRKSRCGITACSSRIGPSCGPPAISRVDFFSEELITAQTDQGQLHIKGEGLHIENLDSASGELLARGKVAAISYTENGPALSFFGRLFK